MSKLCTNDQAIHTTDHVMHTTDQGIHVAGKICSKVESVFNLG